jgi:ribosomal protein S17
MRTRLRALIVAVTLVTAVSAAAFAAQKPVTIGEAITETFTIEAIEHSSRIVTLKDKDGLLEDVICGPEVQRFDALKVGDTVTFRYYESVVTAVRRSSSPAAPPVSSGVSRTPGAAPGGTISQQMTATVTIEAIDTKIPSVTVRATDGRRSSFKVEDPKNIVGYKAGDVVDVTYTRALAVSVTPAKK